MPRSEHRVGRLVDVVTYPIKGLSGQSLDRVRVTPGGIPFDRMLAIAPSGEGHEAAAPTYESFAELFSLDTVERLAGVETYLDVETHRLTIMVQGHLVLECEIDGAAGVEAAMVVLSNVLDLDDDELPRLVRASPEFNYGWPGIENPTHMWACHLVNLATVRDLEERVGAEIDPRRFRANLYVDLDEPDIERSWVGRRFHVGDVELECIEGSTRCATTEVNPGTALRDLPIPRLLMQHYGHTELGIYATIVSSGELSAGLDVIGPSARHDG